ncbi:MAG: SEL1-like repeat protein [Gammaproteobacteria bacterium]|nr:SEL1-like repeat protein [Gammaproteobacteria bacterium]
MHSPKQWRRAATAARRVALGAVLICAQAHAQDYETARAAYLKGHYGQALKIIRPLAEDGNSEAQKLLGVMYDYGHGVKADPVQALQWYIKSAEQGDPAVQYQVGAKYFRGEGVTQDQVQAAKWWELAANGGQVDAQFNLGLMYFRGLAVDRNDARAAELFRKAAEQGHGHAQYSLGVMYAFERGLRRDYGQALDWFNKAAAQGVAQAQFNLGVFYENGYGVTPDLAVAKQWYERAAAQGLMEASDKLKQLAGAPGATPPAGVAHPEDLAAAAAAAASAAATAGDGATAAPPAAPSTRVYVPPAKTVAAQAKPVAAPPVQAPAGPRREDWVRAQRPDSYTLQLGSVTSEQDVVRFLTDAGIADEAAYVKVEINGTTRYNALYGAFASYAEAAEAAGNLPEGLRQVKPWVRNFGIVQQLLK